jgi:hypothetical protein
MDLFISCCRLNLFQATAGHVTSSEPACVYGTHIIFSLCRESNDAVKQEEKRDILAAISRQRKIDITNREKQIPLLSLTALAMKFPVFQCLNVQQRISQSKPIAIMAEVKRKSPSKVSPFCASLCHQLSFLSPPSSLTTVTAVTGVTSGTTVTTVITVISVTAVISSPLSLLSPLSPLSPLLPPSLQVHHCHCCRHCHTVTTVTAVTRSLLQHKHGQNRRKQLD